MTDTPLTGSASSDGDPGAHIGLVEAVPVRRCLLATDMERYGNRTAPDQYEAQRAYQWAMDLAAADSGHRRADWLTQPVGDGELSVLPPETFEASVLGRFVPALAVRLGEYNRRLLPHHRVRLRVAVHYGLLYLEGPLGYPGPGPVLVSRLLGATALRTALATRLDHSLAVIVSESLYHDVVGNGYLGLRTEAFHPVRVADPSKGFSADAWIRS